METLPDRLPLVITSLRVREAPEAARHRMDVMETHELSSVLDDAIRTL
jgi:hypothetical protein